MNIFLVTSVPLTPPWDQGDKNLAYDLTRALPRHRFRVLTARNQARPEGYNLVPEPIYRQRHPTITEKAGVYLRLLTRSASHSTKSTVRHVPDLYHLIYQPFPLSSWLGRALPEFRRRPTLHTVPATANGRPLARSLFFAQRIVAISEHGRQTLRALGLENVTHIPPGIRVNHWRALHNQADRLKARLGLSGRPVLLFPGHYGPGQGADVMLDALPHLSSEVPDVCVIFACRLRSASDQEREREIRLAIDAMGLTRNVLHLNLVTDMEALIGASDLVALPLETMRDKLDIPTTLLESLAAGKPIVISDLSPMNELIKGTDSHASPSQEVGLAVRPGDAKALADSAAVLLSDPGLRKHMGQQGQVLVRTRFDVHGAAKRYAELYREMVQ